MLRAACRAQSQVGRGGKDVLEETQLASEPFGTPQSRMRPGHDLWLENYEKSLGRKYQRGGTSVGERITLEWGLGVRGLLSREVGGGLFICPTGSFRS